MPGAASESRPRVLPVGECTNFRDLGGYATADGTRRTRWGVVYRTDALAKARGPAAARRLTDELHVAHLVDFRSPAETAEAPCDIAGAERHALPIVPGNLLEAMQQSRAAGAGGDDSGAALVAAMVRVYEMLVNECQQQYAAFFRVLLQAARESRERQAAGQPPRAVAFFCSAGKDRTGFAALLLLSALGVPPETIRADYLLTNDNFKAPAGAAEALRARGIGEEGFKALFEVRGEYLDAATEAIRRRVGGGGGVVAYVTKELGVSEAELEELRSYYLE